MLASTSGASSEYPDGVVRSTSTPSASHALRSRDTRTRTDASAEAGGSSHTAALTSATDTARRASRPSRATTALS